MEDPQSNTDKAEVNRASSSEHEMARALLASRSKVNYPIITRCYQSSPGLPSFAEGSPYLSPENLAHFLHALRKDVSLMSVEPAKKVFRRIDASESYPMPESCTPYIDANSLGFYLKPLLPLVFVRTSKGEPLLDARVALKYLRENARKFGPVLNRIEQEARRILNPETYVDLRPHPPWLLQDIVQPYRAFTGKHFSMRAGLWVHTPSGVSTVIGPPINQKGPLSIMTGSIETDWHHFELFVVAEMPDFEGQVYLVEPDTIIAQMYFTAREAQSKAQIRFSADHPGAEPGYWTAWEELGAHLIEKNQGMISEQKGVASVDLSCPHCYASVTAATEQGVPEGHVFRRGFNPAYKVLKHEHQAQEREAKDRDPIQ